MTARGRSSGSARPPAFPRGSPPTRSRRPRRSTTRSPRRWTRTAAYGRYQIFPVAGIFQPTRQSAVVRGDEVEILQTLDGKDVGGDGTVPRPSATPIELSDDAREVYATEAHASLQNFDPVLVQVRGVLTWESLALYKASPADGFRLEVDDLVPPHEPVELTLATSGPVRNVEATAENVDTGAIVHGDGPARQRRPGDARPPPARAGRVPGGRTRDRRRRGRAGPRPDRRRRRRVG